MRPIIIDMNEMSDSKEVYDSRPNKFLTYTIYVVAVSCVIALIWMSIFHIDNVVKSNGIFRASEDSMNVSSKISGEIYSCDISDGDYVNEGDVLFQIKVNESEVEQWKMLGDKSEALKSYMDYLDGEEKSLDEIKDNSYYAEIVNRKNLLETTIDANGGDKSARAGVYQSAIDNTMSDVNEYNQKIDDYRLAENCIYQRVNSFSNDKPYFKSMVDSYISNYNITAAEYDSKIGSLNNQLASSSEEQNNYSDIDNSIQNLLDEKNRALSNLELEQIASIESQIENAERTVQSLKGTVTSAQSEMNSLNMSSASDSKDVQIMTEKANVSKEIEECLKSKSQYDEAFQNYNEENETIAIKARSSGYIYASAEIEVGMYVDSTKAIGIIYPKEANDFYADVYVENQDIANLKEGQEVKFEIAAYPSSDFGYFTGSIQDISKDISVDGETGSAYYVVKVKCDKNTVTNKKGEVAKLKNGMACQAKIIVGNESVMKYVLEKIDLID